MNYLKELNAFYDWLETNSLSTSGIVLWHALMHISNKAGWAAEFGVATSVLCVKTGLSDRAIRNARNELKQKGLIDWRSRGGRKAPVYTLIPLSERMSADNSGKQLPESVSGNHSGNCSGNHSGNCSGNHSALNKLNKTKLNETNTKVATKVATADAAAGQEKITNKQLIAELTEEYRKVIPADKHKQGDYAFIGRLYNEFGYDQVLSKINELGYKVEGGFIPDNPLIYLRSMFKSDGGSQRVNGKSGKRVPRAFASLQEWAEEGLT